VRKKNPNKNFKNRIVSEGLNWIHQCNAYILLLRHIQIQQAPNKYSKGHA
jgi:hypothetical protein